MTGFQRAGEWLDFGQEVGLEIRSPLFDAGTVTGTLSYPVTVQDTPTNRRLLGFPATRSRSAGPVPALDWDYYIGGLLWRRGVLRYQGYDSQAREYTYQFEADADALAGRIEGVTLGQLATLPTLGVNSAFETADYVLAPVRNAAFYGADANPDWGKVLNYAAPGDGAPRTNPAPNAPHRYALAPLVKVVPLLRAVLAEFGYTVSGDWLDDAEVQQLVLYTTRALDQPTGADPAASFKLADVLPDVRLADLLLSLQGLFCLGYVFDPVRRHLRIVALRDVAAPTAGTGTPRRAGQKWRDVANGLDGFTLAFTPDGSDEVLKSAPAAELRIGAGKEKIQPAADTLHMVREADPLLPTRAWLVPAAEQPGQSPRTAFGQEGNRATQLRYLFYRGLQPDSNGALYPLASSGAVDYHYQSVGNYALEWDGPKGLYQQWHKPWLDFRAAARVEEREVTLSLGEFLALDPTVKDAVVGLKFLWERLSLSVGGTGTLGTATITYHQIAQ